MFLTKNYNDLKSINCEWKQKRPHLFVQNIKNYDSENKVLSVDGYLRGSIKLNINRPIHITGFDGHYLIKQIDGLIKIDNDDIDNDGIMNFINNNDEKYETITLIHANKDKQDTLQSLENLDGLASQFDQTIITENELREIEQERQKMIEKEKLENWDYLIIL